MKKIKTTISSCIIRTCYQDRKQNTIFSSFRDISNATNKLRQGKKKQQISIDRKDTCDQESKRR